MEADNNFSLDLLSKAECLEILSNALNCDISKIHLENFKVLPIAEENVEGFLGEYYQLIVEAKIKNSSKLQTFEYFIKLSPRVDAMQNGEEELNSFLKEVGLYKTLFKDLDNYGITKWHPDCYYVRKDIVVMEDLRKSGYRAMNESEEFSLDHIKIVLKSLASMHANSIIFEKKTGINIGEKYEEHLEEIIVYPSSDFGWFQASIQAVAPVAKLIPIYQTNEIQKFLDDKFMEYVDKIIDLGKPSEEYSNVFSHHDLWLKNFLVRFDENDPSTPKNCVIIDFQIARYYPAAFDVLTIFYYIARRKMRQNHMKDLLTFYYDCLKKDLQNAEIDINDHMTWDVFLRSCEELKLLPLLLYAMSCQVQKVPKKILHDTVKSSSSKYNLCLPKDRTAFILDQIKVNELYKECMFECVEEIIEFMIKMKSKFDV